MRTEPSTRRIRQPLTALLLAGAVLCGIGIASAHSSRKAVDAAADEYVVDSVHTAVVFKIEWGGMTPFYGKFNSTRGTLRYDGEDPDTFRCELEIDVESVDTHNEQRDRHLKSPDFFNAREHPLITFRATELEQTDDGYTMRGDLTMRGRTRQVTAQLDRLLVQETRRGVRLGLAGEMTIKRSEWGIDFMLDQGLGDEVKLLVGLQSVRQ